jgi:malonate transporter MadL subunit
MAVYGTSLLALCTLAGVALGEVLGQLLHVKANVGGVGIAMLLLVICKVRLQRQGKLTPGLRLGVEFWAAMYIPIVVAMASQQDVLAAMRGGPMVLLTGAVVVAICFGLVGVLGRVANRA